MAQGTTHVMSEWHGQSLAKLLQTIQSNILVSQAITPTQTLLAWYYFITKNKMIEKYRELTIQY